MRKKSPQNLFHTIDHAIVVTVARCLTVFIILALFVFFAFQNMEQRVSWIAGACLVIGLLSGTVLSHAYHRKKAQSLPSPSQFELQFHLLVESLPQNVYAKDANGRFVFANQRYCATEGKSLKEIIGKTDFDLHPLELAEKYRADDLRVIETGIPLEFEEEHAGLNREKFFVQVIKAPFHDSKGETTGTLGIFWDITERKRSEELLRQQDQQLRTVYEASQRLNRTLDMQEIYQTISDFMSVVAPNDALVISAFDNSTKLITCRAYRLDNKWMDVSSFPPIPLEEEGKGTQSLAIRSGQSMLINDYQALLKSTQTSYYVNSETNEVSEEITANEDVPQSVLIVPLKDGEKVDGVIQVMSYRLDAYNENQLKLLEALALHIVSAKKNAKLYAQVQAELNERRLAEEALRRREAEYRLIADNTGDVIWVLDLESKQFTYASPSAEKLLGYTPQEMLKQSLSTILTPDSLAYAAKEISRQVTAFDKSRSKIVNTDELKLVRKNGSVVQTEASTTFVMNEYGKLQIVSISRDITKRKEAESAQRQSEFQFRALFNLSPDAVMLIDPHDPNVSWPIIDCNEAACLMNGYSRDELIGTSVDIVNTYSADKTERSAYLDQLREKGSLKLEAIHRHKNGTVFPIEVSTTLIKIGDRELVIGIDRDITERKAAEKIQNQQRETLEYHFKLVEILTSISTRFINLPVDQINTEINRALKQLGEFEKVDRSYVFLFQSNHIDMNNTHEWCAPGVEPQIQNLQHVPIDIFPWWLEKLNRGEEVYIPAVSQLPPEAQAEREILETQGIQSLLAIPLISANTLAGFVGFDAVVHPRTWDEDSILLIKMMGDIISNALTRKTNEEAVQLIEKRNQALLENMPGGIVLMNAGGKFTFASPFAYRMFGYTPQEIIGTRALLWVHPEDVSLLNSKFIELLHNPSQTFTSEYRFRHKDGFYLWVEATFSNLLSEPGVNAMASNFRDITEAKHARELLEKSRASLEAAQEIARLGSWELEPQNGTGLFWSKEMYHLFNRTPERGVPELEEFMQMVHPEDRQPLLNAQQCAIENNRLVSIEYRAFPGSNEMRYFRASLQAVKDEQGKVRHVSGTVLDITENRLMEIEIQERVKELTCLFNVSRLLGNRRESIETVCNKIIASIIPAMQFPHLTIPLLMLDDQRYTTDGFDENLAHSLCANIEVDGRVRGQICVFYTRDEPFTIPEEQDMLDNITRMFGLWIEQREAEAAVHATQRELEELNRNLEKRVEERTDELRQREATYRALFENSNDGIFLLSPAGKDLTANQQALKMLGYTLEEYKELTRDGSNTIAAAEQRADADARIADALRGEFIPLYERTFIGKNGKKVEVEINLSPVRDSTGKVIMVQSVVRDITERKKAQEALRESRDKLSAANAALERASHMKDEFLASMSHELRTPLTGILGLSEVLQLQTFGALNEKQTKALKNIESSGRHLLDLINDILDLSKIEAGKLHLQFEPCPVSEICQASLQLMKGMAHQKKQNIDFSIKPALINVRADSRRLKQMLVNLLSNAVKFTPEGGQLGLDVLACEEQKAVFLTVWDKGIGIEPGAMAKLFKPFTQLDSSLARQYSGTGLGLSLVQRMAELHGGSIKVESVPGEGSRFTIILPWSPGVTQPVRISRERNAGALKSAMVIEDNELDAEHAVRYLKGLGIAHITQTVIRGAVEKTALLHPNVILLDLNMPDGSGLELLAKLKADERTRDIPVIVVSVEERCAETVNLGAIGYLLKPYTQQELRTELEKAATFTTSTSSRKIATRMNESGPLVMIADDNEMILEMVSDFLETNGYRVIATRSGVELLERVTESRPDIILMDIQMPVMDGMETIQRLRAQDDPSIASTPIIAITALAMSGDREKCLEAGANEYISKPIVLAQLVEQIKDFLKDKEE